MEKNDAFGWWKGAVISEPEIAMSRFSKGVPIFNPAVEINCFSLIVDFVDFGVAEGAAIPQCFWHHTVCSKRGVKFILKLGRYQRVLVCGLRNCNLSPTNNPVCGCLPRIFERQYDAGF